MSETHPYEPPADVLLDIQRRMAGVIANVERLPAEVREARLIYCELEDELRAIDTRRKVAEARVRDYENLGTELDLLHEENTRLRTLPLEKGRLAWRRVKKRLADAQERLDKKGLADHELFAARMHYYEAGPHLAREMARQETRIQAAYAQLDASEAEVQRAGKIMGVRSSRGNGVTRLLACLVVVGLLAELAGVPVIETIMTGLGQEKP